MLNVFIASSMAMIYNWLDDYSLLIIVQFIFIILGDRNLAYVVDSMFMQ